MTSRRPFRFIAAAPPLHDPAARWRDEVRRIEDLGYDTVAVSEHLTGGWVMEPLAALMAVADASTRLRLLSLVLVNDLRHPAMLHKAAATIDVLSGGRLELGLGAGWLEADFRAAGLPFGDAAVRVERLAESVRVLKLLFGDEPVTFSGRHYRIDGLEGLPRPVQRPRPPILVGGGGRRVLALAAAEADIIAVHAALGTGRLSSEAAADLGAEPVARKVSWVRAQAAAAGRTLDDVDIQFSVYLCDVHDSAGEGRRAISSFSRHLEADPDLLASSPAVLIGSVDECVERLEERRERFGFNYVKLPGDPAMGAPIVARLAGR